MHYLFVYSLLLVFLLAVSHFFLFLDYSVLSAVSLFFKLSCAEWVLRISFLILFFWSRSLSLSLSLSLFFVFQIFLWGWVGVRVCIPQYQYCIRFFFV